MRFGRKNKHRPHVATQAKTEDTPTPSESLESEEGGGLLGTQVEQSIDVAIEDSGDGNSTDPTQQLLTALGRFQRQLTDAHGDSSSSAWSDECMNQLITAVDIALTQEWASIVEALTDTGRILQTYQNSERSRDAVPFLNDAYEVLCLMVGDLIVEKESDALISNWRKLYGGAVRAIEETGLVLAQDDDDGNQGTVPPETTLEIRLPEGIIENVEDGTSSADELSMLDELSPLDGFIDEGLEAPSSDIQESDTSLDELGETESMSPNEVLADSNEPEEVVPELVEDILEVEEIADAPIIEVSVELEEEVAVPEELEKIPEPTEEPTKETASVVVEILDRISEQLAELQNGSEDARDFALERLQGGLSALMRTAKDGGHIVAERLCALMTSTCESAAHADEKTMERMIELGYAFCGTYMEAAEEGETEPVLNWQSECQAIIDELQGDASSTEDAPDIETVDTLDSGIVEIEEISVEEVQVSELETPDELSEEWTLLEPETGDSSTASEGVEAVVSPEDLVDSSPVAETEISEEPVFLTKYAELLASAQEAATKGDRAAAQYFALQAAAHIACTDVEKAEEYLGQAEGRMRDSLEAAETAANEVEEAESRAREISTQVVESEKGLGEVKQAEAEVAQEVQDIQGGIDDLEKQIADLEARRTKEIDQRNEAQGRLSDAENVTTQAQAQLEESKTTEEDSRNYLERCRQHVQDEEEVTGQVEMEVQKAREQLAQREHSSDEIHETITKTCGNEPPSDSGDTADSMLF